MKKSHNNLKSPGIIKLFFVTFNFCYIGNISGLTSGVKVTSEATK
jgi:hypothetical protein